MPYASLKQLRFMHARHPGKAKKIDADIRASGERSINAEHNISTMRKDMVSKLYSEYAIKGPPRMEYERKHKYFGKKQPKFKQFVEYRDDNGNKTTGYMSHGDLEGSKMVHLGRPGEGFTIGKADFFGRQGLKNANERLKNADRIADAAPTADNLNSAKVAAKLRNRALLKRTVRLAPVAAVPVIAAGVAGSEVQRRRQYAPSGYNSGAYVEGVGQ